MALPLLIHLANQAERMKSVFERVDRLETLEYGTAAFPSGAGLICEERVTVATASVTLCTIPATIPATFRHLFLTISCRDGQSGSAAGNFTRLRFNGDAGDNYHFYKRKERPVSVEAEDSANALGSASYISIGNCCGTDSIGAAGIVDVYSAQYIYIPDYASADKERTLQFGNIYRVALVDFTDAVVGGEFIYEFGGGTWEDTSVITSITIFHTSTAFPAFAFQPGTVFRLYGL